MLSLRAPARLNKSRFTDLWISRKRKGLSFSSQQQQMRANLSGASFPNELQDLLQRRLGDLESQLLKKVNELEEEKSQLYNETATHRQRTENTLNSLMNRISDLEKGTHSFSDTSDTSLQILSLLSDSAPFSQPSL